MTAPSLPVELQLLALDRVHFPRSFHSARERTLFFQAASLVHRSWTADAQARLPEHVAFQIRWPSNELEARLDRLEEKTSNGRAMKRLELWWSPQMKDCATLILGLAFRFPDLQELSLRRCASRTCCAEDFAALNSAGREDETPRDTMLGPSLDDLPQGLRFLSLAHIELEMADLLAVARLPHLETLLLTDLAFQVLHWFNLPYPSLRILGVKTSRGYFHAGFLSRLAGSVKHLALVGFSVASINDYRAPNPSLPSHLESFLIHLAPVIACYRDDPDSAHVIEAEANLKMRGEAANVRISVRRNTMPEEVDAFDLEEWALSVGQQS